MNTAETFTWWLTYVCAYAYGWLLIKWVLVIYVWSVSYTPSGHSLSCFICRIYCGSLSILFSHVNVHPFVTHTALTSVLGKVASHNVVLYAVGWLWWLFCMFYVLEGGSRALFIVCLLMIVFSPSFQSPCYLIFVKFTSLCDCRSPRAFLKTGCAL